MESVWSQYRVSMESIIQIDPEYPDKSAYSTKRRKIIKRNIFKDITSEMLFGLEAKLPVALNLDSLC